MEGTRTLNEKLPKGYVKTRRDAGLKFIFSIYAYCIFNILVKNDILTLDSTTYYLINFSIIALCLYNLIYYMDIIKYFNKIEILNYRQVSTMNFGVKFLLWIPILLSGCFAYKPFLMLFGILNAAYIFLATGLIMD